MTDYRLEPLREEHARQILEWSYPEPYDFYDPPKGTGGDEHYVKEFLNPDLAFHAVLGDRDEFIGFCSYGIDGQVPGGNYTEDALDIGLGMKPELTGQGRGEDFFGAILKFAEENMQSDTYRLTVAKFNERALTLYRKFGFREHSEFEDQRFNVPYTILVRES